VALSASGRKVSTIRLRRHRDSPSKPNVVTRKDRTRAGHSSMVIPLHLIVPGSRDIIIGQARPAAGGGKYFRACARV